MLEPMSPNIINDRNIDMGMANPTKREFLVPRKKKSTRITKITPMIMLFSRLLNWSLTISD
jgi:hypothetical protein